MGVTRIQHNLSAMNAMSNYQGNSGRLTNNLEKLSSGYRINSAADDAAGLAISEKMRSQIAGLEKAQDNANDGISLIQTAEGALTEVNSMLTRLKTLATQSANGTYEDGVDRANLQEETNALLEEIDRISQSTNFNGINLLDGSLSGSGSSKRSGEAVTTVISEVASLKTGQTGDADVTGKYSIDTAGTIVSGAGSIAGKNLKVEISYVDAAGNTQTKQIITSAVGTSSDEGVAAALTAAINGDAELSKLFSAQSTKGTIPTQNTKVELTAQTAGTNAAKLVGVKMQAVGSMKGVDGAVQFVASANSGSTINVHTMNATVETVAADKTKVDVIEFNSGTTAFSQGDTITVGDKTYEFVNSGGDLTKVGKGNIAVNIDTASGGMSNLAEALKSNGVTSAVHDNSGTNNRIKIGDLDEIKAVSNAADISTSNKVKGIIISDVDAAKSKANITVTSGSGKKASVEIEYTDNDGKVNKVSVSYTTSSVASTNQADLLHELQNNDDLKNVFDMTSDGDKIVFQAKNKGAGASIKSVTTSDTITDSVGKLNQLESGRDRGQTIALDVDKISSGDTLTIDNKTFQFVKANELDTVAEGNVAVILDKDSQTNTVNNLNLAFKQNGVNAELNEGTGSFYIADGSTVSSNGGLVLQVGDTNDDFQKVSVQIDDMSSKGLGLKGLDISDQDKAGAAIDTIEAAVNKVSMQRGKLGALQNRLDHTLNNLDATQQNITAAESQIRDVDMAKEMTQYSKNNILVQAAQSMLAQANSLPQGVLSLLQ
jgi:flagellin